MMRTMFCYTLGMENVSERNYSEEEKLQRRDFIEYLREIKEKVENKEFEPSVDWETIWVLSGPEHEFSEESAENAEDKSQNQTKERIEKGFDLLKQVTAMKAGKDISDLTKEDYEKFSPVFYFNGGEGRSIAFQKMVASGYVEETYGIPASSIRISESDPDILHTGHQFEEYPDELLNKGKTIVVSSWCHTPRVQEYINALSDAHPDADIQKNMLVYPANLDRLRIGRAIGEAKKVWDYFEHSNVKE